MVELNESVNNPALISSALHNIPVNRQLYCRYAQPHQLDMTIPLYADEAVW